MLTGNAAYMNGGGAYQVTLIGCIISNNVANGGVGGGGGASSSSIRRCTFIGNSANSGGGAHSSRLEDSLLLGNRASALGGGAYSSSLTNCVLAGNSAAAFGGGVSGSVVFFCTIVSNSASRDGGIDGAGYCNNCIVYFNSGGNYGSPFSYYSCCTTPLPAIGTGNVTNEPVFVDAAAGNFHLQSNSPCINADNNAYVSGATDLDGNPRIVGGTADIGAYEFQSPASQLSYAWLQQFLLPTDGSVDFLDLDGDTRNNWEEWICGTDPTNALSVLRLGTPSTDGTNVVLRWEGVYDKRYRIERSKTLGTNSSFQPISGIISGNYYRTNSFTDTNATPAGLRFYRVGVQ